MSDGAERIRSRRGRDKDKLVGEVLLDKYRILSVLASGGMGTVYRAEQISLRREVAVKVTDNIDDEARKRFFREARLLAKLQHPNILTVFDYGPLPNVDDGLFMVMELLKGTTLRGRLREAGTLPPIELLAIMDQVARGLRAAHRQKLVHRDLKPSNLMLVPQDDGSTLVKILDFGLVKILEDDVTEVTQVGSVVGSPHYIAPELLTGAELDHRADIYALGVLMYQALVGKPPFDEPILIDTLRAHVERPVPLMKTVNADVDVPEPLEALVRSCLAKLPDHRPADMDEFGRALHACEWEMGVVPTISTRLKREALVARSPEIRTRSHAPESPTPESLPPASQAPQSLTPLAPLPPSVKPQPTAPARDRTRWRTAVGMLATAIIVGALTWLAASNVKRSVASGPTATNSFLLYFDSTPSAATVRSGGKIIGVTPFRLTLDNETLCKEPMRMSVELNGHRPLELVQGPSDDCVRIVAALAPEGAPSASK